MILILEFNSTALGKGAAWRVTRNGVSERQSQEEPGPSEKCGGGWMGIQGVGGQGHPRNEEQPGETYSESSRVREK